MEHSGHAEHSEAAIKKHVRRYVYVFMALMALTVVTVAISYLHLSTAGAVTIALIVASIKGFLVASVFMHLMSEKKAIYYTLLLTLVFFVVLMWLPLFADADHLGH
jgi:cytochrome c oxidase subunit 4